MVRARTECGTPQVVKVGCSVRVRTFGSSLLWGSAHAPLLTTACFRHAEDLAAAAAMVPPLPRTVIVDYYDSCELNIAVPN